MAKYSITIFADGGIRVLRILIAWQEKKRDGWSPKANARFTQS